MSRVLSLLAVVLCLALAPAAALAQSSPFAPLPAPATTPQTTTTSGTSTTTDDGGGLHRWQELLIFFGGVILLGGIGYYIVLDARKSAPVKPGEDSHMGEVTKKLPKAKTKPVRREKARRARAARKRNR